MKFIELTQGKRAMVDNVIYPFISDMNWHVKNNGYGLWYAVHNARLDKRRIKLSLHQFVWYFFHNAPVPEGLEIDHKNRNGLDCRGKNLRVVTHWENLMNRKARKNNVSGVVGVSRYKKKWVVHIGINGRVLHLGYYFNKKDAVKVRRLAEIKYFGKSIMEKCL